MLTYIETKNESSCCGCRACNQICPVQAITMKKNHEGFFYPDVDTELCINCALCEKVCPQMVKPQGAEPMASYAVQHKDEKILAASSSGGVFRLLADEIILAGGCVVGCVWDDNYCPKLKIVDSISQLQEMQGSKYISSDTGNVYKQVKERLETGQQVLFTGAPCQCAGLLKYLGKTYENLFTADFLCHGMPSQEAFDYYLDAIKDKHGLKSHIISYSFRDKEKRGWGIVTSLSWMHKDKKIKKYRVGKIDAYCYGFVNGYFNRYSCYSCCFKGEKRFTDFTFCDYWGVQEFHPELETSKGVSACSVNTMKAIKVQERLANKAIWLKTSLENIAKENPSIIHTDKEEIPDIRREIYSLLSEYKWDKVEKKYLREKQYFIKCIWYSIPKSFTKIIKKVLNIG